MNESAAQTTERVVSRIRAIRRVRRMSQRELGERTGLSRDTIANLETRGKGENIRLTEAVALANALGFPLEMLLSSEPVEVRANVINV